MVDILLLGESETAIQIKNSIKNYLAGTYYENASFGHFKNIKSIVNASPQFDLLIFCTEYKKLLSYDTDKMNGLIDMINRNNAVTILVSDEKNCPIEYLKLRTIDYLAPSEANKLIEKKLDEFFSGRFAISNMFHYRANRCDQLINVKRILFFQSDTKKIIIHTKNGNDAFYGKLSECSKQPCIKNFMFIHQSFLVNPLYIDEIKNKKVYINGKALPISRKYLGMFKK